MDTENGIAVKDAVVELGVGVGAVVAVIDVSLKKVAILAFQRKCLGLRCYIRRFNW